MARSQMPCPLLLLCSLLLLPSLLLADIGDAIPVDVNKPGVRAAAQLGLEEYNKGSQNANYFKQLRIAMARAESVDGVMFYVMVEVAKTVCKKGMWPMPFSEIQKCKLPPYLQQETMFCNFDVLYKDPEWQLKKSKCD